jgi:two-component system, NarL family, nitrate/nitrite response regulator NarL
MHGWANAIKPVADQMTVTISLTPTTQTQGKAAVARTMEIDPATAIAFLQAGSTVRLSRSTPATRPKLTKRQHDLLRGMARGLTIAQIAAELYIGTSTAKTHAQALFRKLDVCDRAAAVAQGMRYGLIN